LREAVAAFDRAASLHDRVRSDLAFHLAIVRGARNALVETMFLAIQPYTVELMIRSLTDEGVTTESVPYHQRICDAVAAGDGPAATEAMRQHLAVGLALYGDDLDRNLDVVTRRSLVQLTDGGLGLHDLLPPSPEP
jgi:DNA-binding FadR family transcriptional regulator